MGLKDWWKRNKSRDVRDIAGDGVRALPGAKSLTQINLWSKENTPTFRRWGSNLAQGASSAGNMMVDGARQTAKSLFQLSGKFTWVFFLLALGFHAILIVSPPQVYFTGFSDFFYSWLYSFNNYQFSLYIILALLATLVFYSDASDPFIVRRGLRFLLFTICAYSLTVLIHSYALTTGPAAQKILDTVWIFSFLWVYYIMADPGDKVTVGFRYIVYIALTLVIFMHVLAALQSSGQTTPIDQVNSGWPYVRTLLVPVLKTGQETVTNTKSAIENFRESWNRELNDTVKDYYAGQVDQTQGAPLGVYVEQPTTDYLKYYISDGDSITATAILRARTLADQEIVINNACHLELVDDQDLSQIKTVNVTGKVVPATSRFVYTAAFQDQQDIQCVVSPDATTADGKISLKQLVSKDRVYTGTVVFESTFDFATLAYMQYAFMDKDLFVSMRRDNLNPAQEMSVVENPVAIYTPGPLMIGMARDSQPFPITENSNSQTELPAFGLTFSSATYGKGRLDKFSDLHLYIPQQFELDRQNCIPHSLVDDIASNGELRPYSTNTAETTAQPWKENDQYFDYILRSVQIKPDETYFTLRCPLVRNRRGAGSNLRVLTPAGASLFTFYAQANYSFTAEARTTAIIQGSSSVYTPTSTSGSGTSTPSSTPQPSGTPSQPSQPSGSSDGTQTATSGASTSACKTVDSRCPDPNEANTCYCYYYDTNGLPVGFCKWTIGEEATTRTCG